MRLGFDLDGTIADMQGALAREARLLFPDVDLTAVPRSADPQGSRWVYRRTGEPCFVCGAAVRTQALVARNLYWCPRCQPRFRSRASR